MTKSGDHENYHAGLDISNFKNHLINKNCLFINADCSAKAVKIRTKQTHYMWPTNKKNILMFSSSKFENEEEIEYHWHKAVNATYG